MTEIKVNRKRGKPWVFAWKNDYRFGAGFFYYGREHVYRLMLEDTEYKQIWIAILLGDSWCTVEGYLGVTSIEFNNGTFYFGGNL